MDVLFKNYVFLLCGLARLDVILTALTPEDINCSFENDFCKWYRPSFSQRSWSRTNKSLSQHGSGPSAARVGNYYAFFDTSDPSIPEGTRAYLVSPNITQAPLPGSCLLFYFHMYGNEMGKLSYGFEAYQDASAEKTFETNYGNEWHCWVFDLKNAAVGDRIFFSATKGRGTLSIIAIDNITLYTGAPKCTECKDVEDGTIVYKTSPPPTTSTQKPSITSDSTTLSTSTTTIQQPTASFSIVAIVGVLAGFIVVMAAVFVALFLIFRRRWMRHPKTSHHHQYSDSRISEDMNIARKMSQGRNRGPYVGFPNGTRIPKNYFDDSDDLKHSKSETGINVYDLPDDEDHIYSVPDIDKEIADDGGYLHAQMSETDLREVASDPYLHPESDNTEPIDEEPSNNSSKHNSENLDKELNGGGYLHSESVLSDSETDVPNFTLLDETCDDSSLEFTTDSQRDGFSYTQDLNEDEA